MRKKESRRGYEERGREKDMRRGEIKGDKEEEENEVEWKSLIRKKSLRFWKKVRETMTREESF